MIELIVLFIGIIILSAIIYYNTETETFQDYTVNTCPFGWKSEHDKNGNMVCCSTDFVAGQCFSQSCTLTKVAGMKSCVDIILEQYKEQAIKFCPPSKQQYYEGKDLKKGATKGLTKGCTSGRLNDTLSGPLDNKETCIIYENEKELTSLDSCYNAVMLEKTQCLGVNCTKKLYQEKPTDPVVVQLNFKDAEGIPRVAYTKQSYEIYLKATNPTDPHNPKILESEAMSEVANKKYFPSV